MGQFDRLPRPEQYAIVGSVIAGLPYLLLGVVFVMVFAIASRHLPEGRVVIYGAFTATLLIALRFDFSWVNFVYIAAAVGIFIAEEVAPRNSQVGTEPETIHSAAYAILKRVGGPIALTILVYSGISSWRPPWGLSSLGTPVWIQGLVILVVLDFKQYWLHRGQHQFSIWWRFHRVHHYSKHMSAVAHGRTHLVELAVVQILSSFVIVSLLGIDHRAVLYGFILPGSLIAGLWSHANLDVPRRKSLWMYVIGNPNAHALHHTQVDDRRNYGEILLVWDVIFGTFKSPVTYRDQLRDYGVRGHVPTHSIVKEQLLVHGFESEPELRQTIAP